MAVGNMSKVIFCSETTFNSSVCGEFACSLSPVPYLKSPKPLISALKNQFVSMFLLLAISSEYVHSNNGAISLIKLHQLLLLRCSKSLDKLNSSFSSEFSVV
jgi:hypothetical protein